MDGADGAVQRRCALFLREIEDEGGGFLDGEEEGK